MIEKTIIKSGYKTSDGKIFTDLSQAEKHEDLYQKVKNLYCKKLTKLNSIFDKIRWYGEWLAIRPNNREELTNILKYYTREIVIGSRWEYPNIRYGEISFVYETYDDDSGYNTKLYNRNELLEAVIEINNKVNDIIVNDVANNAIAKEMTE